MRAARLRRWAALAGGLVAAVLLAATPAQAKVNDGEIPAHLGWVPTVLIYVISPLVGFALIGVLVYLPSWLRKPRYRPALAWEHDAIWFSGPDDPDSALQSVTTMQVKGGGASASW